ncbi:hypothetical protein L1887_42358 [Cichorium endivia]|nr:hypothetical protein L1887_42358 [Cichorium endivia]
MVPTSASLARTLHRPFSARALHPTRHLVSAPPPPSLLLFEMTSHSTGGLAHFSATSLFDVRGLTAVVTGGSSGLGLYAAQALAANGALVYILGRREDRLSSAVETFRTLLPDPAQRHSGDLVAIQADITSKCGQPREHAAAVLYLASRASNFANGTTMRVDGGALQRVSPSSLPCTD